MFSSVVRANEYIATTQGVWPVQCVSLSQLLPFFEEIASISFDCVAVDFLNTHHVEAVQCFDAYKAADAIRPVDEKVNSMPEVETWHVFM